MPSFVVPGSDAPVPPMEEKEWWEDEAHMHNGSWLASPSLGKLGQMIKDGLDAGLVRGLKNISVSVSASKEFL